MSTFRFTGNPFVDAGIAGICAAAGVTDPAELDERSVQHAVKRLLRIFTSPQALEPRPKPGDEKNSSAFATSELSAIFPNGPHSNPSNKGEKKAELYRKQVNGLVQALYAQDGFLGTCFACGQPAIVTATKMDFPLLDSRRNFHPSLSDGHAVCATCALAIQFLPLSVLRTSIGGLFWFVSCLDPDVCIPPTAELSLAHMERCLASNSRLRFYGDWAIPGKASAVIAVVDLLAKKKREWNIKKNNQFPVRAVFFSNDNRGGDISVLEVPNSIFRFFSKLNLYDWPHEQFVEGVLHIPKFGESIAQKLLGESVIIDPCTVIGKDDDQSVKLLGGWLAHCLYMKEVLNMQDSYISTVEDIALEILETEDPAKELKKLKLERNPMNWFLNAISARWMTRQQLYKLVTPNDREAMVAALDYITGALAEAVMRRERGEEFRRWDAAAVDSSKADVHPLIQLVEEVGDVIIQSNYDPVRLLENLRKARYQSDLRWAWLRALQSGAINWQKFVLLVPPEDNRTAFTIRDYMLAYLYDRTGVSVEPITEEAQTIAVVSELSSDERRQ